MRKKSYSKGCEMEVDKTSEEIPQTDFRPAFMRPCTTAVGTENLEKHRKISLEDERKFYTGIVDSKISVIQTVANLTTLRKKN